MSLLFKIIYAAHANGTHHKLALDALQELSCVEAGMWRRMFLKHAELYIEGSKAPDKEFKDFKNHVLHPGDEYWGGAPEKARNWYSHLVTALAERNWSEAAYCAGVLSHYYTDPVMPFHTAQSDAENSMHRAVEWSINRSYDSLRREALQQPSVTQPPLPSGEQWIEEFVCASADHSHSYYEKLIAHYDLKAGVDDPLEGLDPVARRFVGSLLLYASAGFAKILARAINESGAQPEPVTLTAQTVIAALNIPAKWVTRKLADAEDRRIVEAMFDELQQTGRVEETLPEDDRAVRTAHEREVAAPRRAAREAARAKRIGAASKPAKRSSPVLSGLRGENDAQHVPPQPLPELPVTAADIEEANVVISMASKAAPATEASKKVEKLPRTFLAAEDDIVDAPSIGGKTAERLAPAGLFTVADLLRADPDEVAAKVEHRYITAKAIAQWQDQARLVMEIPGLRGTHAQLLTGAGYASAQAVAEADPGELSSAILRYASSNEGKRLLRDGAAPDIEKIKGWIDNAAYALKAA